MKRVFLFLAIGAWAGAAAAQQSAPAVDIATALKQQHAAIRRNLAAAAEKMPEDGYAFRPQGTAPEVRNFGQIVIHLINANNNFCARAKGDSPKARIDEKATMSKAELVKALTEAFAYCDAVYDAQTMATLTEMVASGNNRPAARGNGLIANLAHNNETYGTIAVYFRAKGLIPPSSEGR